MNNNAVYFANSLTKERGGKHVGTRAYVKNSQHSRSKQTKNESFFEEFSKEIDIFCEKTAFPEWIYDYREDILNRIAKPFRVMCQSLKDAGVDFKVKYPIKIDGKWKFADVYVPRYRLVILLTNEMETVGLPCHSMSNRELWFSDRFRTLAVYGYELNRLTEKYNNLIKKL